MGYGFPEMADGHRVMIERSKRISNPGCYPTGFIGLTAPLVRAGLIPACDADHGECGVGLYGRRQRADRGVLDSRRPETTHDAFRTMATRWRTSMCRR
jgi:N-acetyl-gamma-glutamyl-phosphate reductase